MEENQQLGLLHRLSIVLGTTLDLGYETATFMAWLVEATKPRLAALFVTDEAKQERRLLEAYGFELPAEPLLPVGLCVWRWLAEQDAPVLDEDDPRRYAVPICIEQQVLGSVCVISHHRAEELAEQQRLVSAAVGYLAPVLRNIHRHRTLEQQVAERTVALEDANRALQSELAERRRGALTLQRAEAELRRLKEFHASIVHSMAEGIAVEDSSGCLTFVNPAATSLLGYRPEELLGRQFTDIIPPDQQPIIQAADTRRQRGETDQHELELVRQDGTRLWVLMSRVSRIRGGEFAGALTVFSDITDRIQRERELEALGSVATALRAATTRAQMLPIILDQLLNLLHVEGAAVNLRDPATGEVVIELARGAWAQATGVRIPPGEGLVGHVLATGRPYTSDDVRTDPRLRQPDLFGDARAVACVPLIAREQTIGALWVGRQTPIAPAEVQLLTAIAGMAASAIHRAALHEQTEQRLQRLTALRNIDMAITASVDVRLVLDIVLDQAISQLGVDAAAVLLLNPHTHVLEHDADRGFRSDAISRSRLRLGEGYAGRAALERRLVHVPNLAAANDVVRAEMVATEGFVTYYAAPLIAKGQVQGVLEVFQRAPHPPSGELRKATPEGLSPRLAADPRQGPDPEWLDFLEALATQTAIAIDNARLFADLQRSNLQLTLAYDITLEGWARALALRDPHTEDHTRRVAEMTLRLARAMDISEEELVHVRRGALLHDIGKLAVPDSILFKPGELTDEEWEVIRRHPGYAYELLSPIAPLKPALDIPYCHHEKWDGTGYPRRLKGEQIPLAARIFAVVDVWDALLSERPYRPAWPTEKVLAHIREQAGKHFDPRVVDTFLRVLRPDRL